MEYSGNDVNIIHLSDLHIQNISGGEKIVIANVLNNLLQDISNYTEDYNELIIVVSGDIINKGNYSKSNIDAALFFFKTLKTKIGNKIKGIIFAPGNHDVNRSDDSYESNCRLMNSNIDERISLVGYSAYIDLINSIYELFGFQKADSTFGINTFVCNTYKICLVYLDTAWATTALHDRKQGEVFIGSYQIDKLIKAYQNLDDKEDYITVVVSHYPLAWIDPKEQEKFKLVMLSKDGLNADIYLCGHIHDVDSIHYSTHEHSILTLVTGVGWPPSVTDNDRTQRRYSIYCINPIRNTCDIIVRVSNKKDEYSYDSTVYTEEREKELQKIVYPLRSAHNSLAFLPMNTPDNIKTKNVHISQGIAEKIQNISFSLSKFNSHMTDILTRYKQSAFEEFFYSIDNQDELDGAITVFFDEKQRECYSNEEMKQIIVDEIESFLFSSSDEVDLSIERKWKSLKKVQCNISRYFEAFLSEMCQKVVDDFQNDFPLNAEMRVHFRKHSNSVEKNKDIFRCICHKNNRNSDNNHAVPRDIQWGGLIEKAFLSKKTLVFSANMHLNNTKTGWQEFITVIPQFNDNVNRIRSPYDRRKFEERPRLTFGISIKDTSSLDNVAFAMAVLDFLGIEKHISNFIDDYSFYLGISW